MLPLALVALTMAFAGCGGGKNGKDIDKVKVVNDVRLPGDSTFYGLACDGCTDSVLVVLPADDSDPVLQHHRGDARPQGVRQTENRRHDGRGGEQERQAQG